MVRIIIGLTDKCIPLWSNLKVQCSRGIEMLAKIRMLENSSTVLRLGFQIIPGLILWDTGGPYFITEFGSEVNW